MNGILEISNIDKYMSELIDGANMVTTDMIYRPIKHTEKHIITCIADQAIDEKLK